MYIVVVGGGKLGYHLSKSLVAAGHEVLVLERDPIRCERISEELGTVAFLGDGCEAMTLEEIGAGRADIVIAATGGDEDNLVACQVSKHKFNVPRTISIVNDPRNERLFKKLGVDVTVSATSIVLGHLEQQLPEHPLTHLLSLEGAGLEMVSVKIPGDASIAGSPLGDIRLPAGSVVSLVIGKDGSLEVPAADLILEAEDEVVAVTRPENEEQFRAAFTGDSLESSHE